jgi:hypothetical protein
MAENTLLETGIDQLARLLDQYNRISIKEASAKLKTSRTLIQEWAKLLEDEGILSIEYKFASPFLVKREISKEDVENKIQEFHVTKDTFVRKGELMLSQLDDRGLKLSKLKDKFDKLKKHNDRELKKFRSELERLEQCKKEREGIRLKLYEQRKALLKEADDLKQKVHNENENFNMVSSKLKNELFILTKRRLDLAKFEKSEEKLIEEVNGLKEKLDQFNKEYSNKIVEVKDSESKVQTMDIVLKEMIGRMENEKNELISITRINDKKEKDIAKLEESIAKKIQKHHEKATKDSTKGEKTYKRFKSFFQKRAEIENLLEKTLLDKRALGKILNDLITKAKALSIVSRSSKLKKDIFANEIAKLENNFKEIDKKRSLFDSEVKKFVSLIKGK